MATTKIWDVRGRLDHVLTYAKNPDKTEVPFTPGDLQALRDVMDYATNDFKTERQLFVTGINCNSEFARDQMQETKQRWHKEGGIIAYHGYQSFAAGEVTPEQAHRIGVELAQTLWGDRFEVLVATHLNTGHVHNHFVLNSVSFLDGKRYYDNRASYGRMREVSDALCRQNRLSVIENSQPGRSRSHAEWWAEQQGKPTVRSLIREDIDAAIAASATASGFWREMQKRGYAWKLTGVKYPAIRPPGHSRFFRLNNLGDAYTVEAIYARILQNQSRIAALPEQPRKKTRSRLRHSFQKGKRITGLRALYFKYLYLLGVLPRQRPRKPARALRADIIKMDRIAAQTVLLWEHSIDTQEQLSLYRSSVQSQIRELTDQRRTLRNALRRTGADTPEQIRAQIAALTRQLSKLRRERGLCDEIAVRSGELPQRLREAEQEENPSHNKEDKHHERIQ